MIIDSLRKDKLIIDARDLYSEIIVKIIYPGIVTYASLMYGFCLIGQVKEAIECFITCFMQKPSS